MRHDYDSYSISAPTIKNPSTLIEDVTGDLTTTRRLIDTLVDDIEGVRDFGQAMIDRPGQLQGEALTSRADSLWALGEAISARMKDSIILLHALIDQRSAAIGKEG